MRALFSNRAVLWKLYRADAQRGELFSSKKYPYIYVLYKASREPRAKLQVKRIAVAQWIYGLGDASGKNSSSGVYVRGNLCKVYV